MGSSNWAKGSKMVLLGSDGIGKNGCAHPILEPVHFGDHGIVRTGDVLILVLSLLHDGVIVDVAICSHSHCQGLVTPGLVRLAHIQRVLRNMDFRKGSCAARQSMKSADTSRSLLAEL